MKIEEIKEQCTGCTACISVCPKQCIQMKMNEEGFFYPQINQDVCIQCGNCERICHCLKEQQASMSHCSYYGASLSDEVLNSSSSGGAFYHLAKEVLDDGGIVFGAAIDYENRLLKHMSTDDVALSEIQKSKYIESSLGETIATIQDNIKNMRKVLFCGTPCQVSGVKRATKDDAHLLLTCDFICHGVPSPGLFQEHLKHIHGRKNEKLISIDFRPKDLPWSGKYIKLRTRTRTRTRTRPYYLDSYYYGFMTHNAFLRNSCYHCQFRNNHVADVTIADFWGWRDYNPNLNTEKGLSLIIANTEYGIQAVEKMTGFDLHVIDNKFSDYVYAPKDYSQGKKLRDKFYRLRKQYGFEKAARMTYMRGYYKKTAKYYIKKFLKREL